MDKTKSYEISKYDLVEAFKLVKANRGSAGVDGITIDKFEGELKNNLYKIWNRMSSGTYFPPPVKIVEIPKKNGGVRKLGIPTVSANCTKVQYPFGKCHDYTPISSIMWPGI